MQRVTMLADWGVLLILHAIVFLCKLAIMVLSQIQAAYLPEGKAAVVLFLILLVKEVAVMIVPKANLRIQSV